MKTIARLVAAAGLAIMLTGAPATASSAIDSSDAVLFSLGHHTYYADGSVEVELPADTFSLSECASGRFCVWSQANYTGSFRYKTGSGVKSVGGTVGSFWNNRSSAARLYNNTSSSSTCYASGVMKASVTTSYASAEQVNLLSGGC